MSKKQKGAALVEFAIILPVLLLVLVGTLQFGWLVNSYMILANATDVGARFFAKQASSATAYADTKTQIIASAAGLNTANITVTTSVVGTSCADPNCGTALSAGKGGQATVTATYTFTPLMSASLYYLIPTTLNHSTSERVQ